MQRRASWNISVGSSGEYGRLHVDGGEDGGIVVSGAAKAEKAMFYNRINGVPNGAAVTGTRAIAVDVVNGGNFTPVFEVKGNGNTFVNGKICAKEVNVRVGIGECPDYVFEPDYELRPLSEVRDFIRANCHLPEIPSATEAERNGLEIGDFQLKLLKKIEELTLYVLRLEEEIQKLKSE